MAGIWARASIRLDERVRPGDVVFVNPDSPWIRDCISAGFLEPVGDVGEHDPQVEKGGESE